jgi:hypothetical protein
LTSAELEAPADATADTDMLKPSDG